MSDVTTRQMKEHFLADEQVILLTRVWEAQLPTLPTPDREQMLRWIRIHRFDIEPLLHAFKCAAKKLHYQPGCFHDDAHPIAYVSRAANLFRRPSPAVQVNDVSDSPRKAA